MFYFGMNVSISKISLNNNFYCKQENTKKSVHGTQTNSSSLLTFSGLLSRCNLKAKEQEDREYFSLFVNKPGKVTQSEYRDIKKNHPGIIFKAEDYVASKYNGYSTPITLARMVLKTDRYLKKNFKNYRIISVGTSPAALCEQLSALGHEVVFLPVSGLRDYDPKKHKIEDIAELQAVMEYLESKNIDDGKLNIVLDFTSSGTTLDVLTLLIKEYFNFEDDKVLKIPLHTLFRNSMKHNILLHLEMSADSYVNDAAKCFAEEISNVPHFYVLPENFKTGAYDFFIKEGRPKEELFEKFEEYSTPLARAFSLCTMYEADKGRKDNL